MRDQKPLSLFGSLLQSCARFSFYGEAAQGGLGRGVAFLALIAVVSAISFTVYVNQSILPSLERASDKLPTISIKNGKVAVESLGESPRHTTLYADPQKVLRIDLDLEGSSPTRNATSEYDYTVVIKKYAVILKRLTGEPYVFGLPYGFSFTFSKNWLAIFVHSYLWLILLLVLIGSFIGFFVVRLIQALVLSIPGLLFWGILRRDLTYGKLLAICMFAVGPASLVSILILWLNEKFMLPIEVLQYQWAIFLVISLEYLVGGLVAIQPHTTPHLGEEKTLTERMF